MREHSTEKPTN